ncbi:hypothetical protein GF326_05495 [Candidatus Bathyarchaeota archaeon]|nr:hypothetical protein [Candidatus Bathyarchaeota archaeon]
MKYIMSHRKGVSSILGVLIFIGILFSAVMPMFLMMRQSDVYYEQAKLEVNRLDEEKLLEDIKVYVSPDESETEYDLTLVNKGEVPVTVVRVWENENLRNENEIITAQDTCTIESIPFSHTPDENEVFEIRVTTERGNSFLNENGMLTYGAEGWIVDKFYINIHAGGLFLRVKVYNCTTDEVFFDKWDTIGVGYQVEVPFAGENYKYDVLIEEKFLWMTDTIYDSENGDPKVWIDWPDTTFADVYPGT